MISLSFLKKFNHKYLIIGSAVFIFEICVIIVAQKLGSSAIIAVGLSFWFGLIFSFTLQKLVTFNDKRKHPKILVPQFFAFLLLVFFNFGFTIIVTKLLSPPLPPILTRTLALAVTTIWNFYLYKTRIFKNSDVNNIY